METVVGVEGNEELKVEDSGIGVADSSEHIAADPVIYKLVRVDGNGRLVPATDDEIMVVEDLLEDDKSKQFVMDSGQTVECGIEESCTLEKIHSDHLGGTLESDNIEAVTEKLNVPHELAVGTKKPNKKQEETVLPLARGSCDSSVIQPGNSEGCSNPPGGLIEKGSENSAIGASWKPDFSKLKGEICLDNLTVKELQETFKATFGRETSVKDKQWLKRRIVMGLTNSCDFSATSFVIKDGKVVNKGRETSKSMDVEVSMGPIAGTVSENAGASSDHCDNQIEENFPAWDALNSPMEYNRDSEDLNTEQKVNKRIRKPTKRYIEELSEVESMESGEKLPSSNRNFGHKQPHQEASIRFIRNVQSSRPLVMRQDSLGGSGVQVPYVSRIRRGRPRENIMALVKLQPSDIGIGMPNRQVKKAFGIHDPQLDDKKGNEILQSRSSPGEIQQPLIATCEKGNQHLDRRYMELENGAELQNLDSFADSSDDNAVKVTIPQGGMRRKHHRPWTLSEVVKLVEGVAKYGAGRWSEIKRVAFASSSYRTSVDLKDKWRNLLRASFAQLPAEAGMQNSRKHSSVPIPVPILVRVRELAEMQAQVTPIVSASKLAGHSSSGSVGSNVHEKISGYL